MTSNYKNSVYSRSFLCEIAKIEQRTPSKKELYKIGEEAIRESRFISFLYYVMYYIYVVISEIYVRPVHTRHTDWGTILHIFVLHMSHHTHKVQHNFSYTRKIFFYTECCVKFSYTFDSTQFLFRAIFLHMISYTFYSRARNKNCVE